MKSGTYLNSALSVTLSSLKLEQLTTKTLKQNSNSHEGVELCVKTEKHKTISGISDAIFPARHPQKSPQHVRPCAAGDGAICSKNRKIVPYHGANPNTWNGARLRSPSPIMAPGLRITFHSWWITLHFIHSTIHLSIHPYFKNVVVFYIPLTNRVWGPYRKLRTEFFPLRFMPQARSARAINRRGKNEDP